MALDAQQADVDRRVSRLGDAVDADIEAGGRRVDRQPSIAHPHGQGGVVRDSAAFHPGRRLLADLHLDGLVGAPKERELAGRLEVVGHAVDREQMRIAVAPGAAQAAARSGMTDRNGGLRAAAW